MSDEFKSALRLSSFRASNWEASAHPDDLRMWSVADIAQVGFSALKHPLPNPANDALPEGWEKKDWDVMLDLGRGSPWYPKVMIELYRHGGSFLSFLCQDLDELSEQQVTDRSRAILARRNLTVHEVINDHGHEPIWIVRSRIHEYSHQVANIWSVALELSNSLKYPILSPNSHMQDAILALRVGAPDALIGLRESSWLEFKSILPDTTRPVGKIELAKDVAQFANSPSGGLLVYGVRTKNDGKGDVAKKIVPLSLEARRLNSIRNIIERRIIHPFKGCRSSL